MYSKKCNINFYSIMLFFLTFGCVYYNTFYNAEVSFDKANKIIEQSPLLDKGDIPPQAKKLLGEAINNAKIVLDKYSDSKYVDDAYFLISKASFLRGEIANSEKYLNLLIKEYPTSKFFNEANVWLAYTQFRLGLSDSSIAMIKEINSNTKLTDFESFLIHNINAEIALDNNQINLALEEYELAAKLALTKSSKTSIFLKLVSIAEKNQKLEQVVDYLYKLSIYAPDQISKNAKLDWIKYNRKLGNYKSTITEIENLLGLADYKSIYIKLELEQAKIYLDQKDFRTAKLLLSQLTENYQRKNESAEAFYLLGYIALMEDFDLKLAEDYFDNSKKDKSSSEYGKKSKEMKKIILDFNSLLNDYDYSLKIFDKKQIITEEISEIDSLGSNLKDNKRINFDHEINSKNDLDEKSDQSNKAIPLNDKVSSPDSLLFTIAEKLLYDFNKKDIAIEKFKELVNSFPDSKFQSQSLFVLSNFDSDSIWKKILKDNFPNSKFINFDKSTKSSTDKELMRDNAWELASVSYEKTAEEFLRLFNEESDTLSLYLYAYVQDYYLNDMFKSIDSYQLFNEISLDSQYTDISNQRLKQINDGLNLEIDLTKQKKNYSIALQKFKRGENLDSVISVLESVIKGDFSNYRSSAQSLIKEFNSLQSYKSIINADTTEFLSNYEKADSVLFNLGNIFYRLDNSDSARIYYKNLIDNFDFSKYKHLSLLTMIDLEPNEGWQEKFSNEYPDSLINLDVLDPKLSIISDSKTLNFVNKQTEILSGLVELTTLFAVNDSIDIDTNLIGDEKNKDFSFQISDSVDSIIKIRTTDQFIESFKDTIFSDTADSLLFDSSIINLFNLEDEVVSNTTIDTKEIVDYNDNSLNFKNILNYKQDSLVEIPEDLIKTEYIVNYGENLESIAKEQLGSYEYWQLIYDWNKKIIGPNPGIIYPYQILYVYKKSSNIKYDEKIKYIVKQNETLWLIAKKLYNDPYAWVILFNDNANIINNPDDLKIGDEIMVRKYLAFD